MKRKCSLFIILFLFFLANLSFGETIKVSFDEWPPFTSSKEKYSGVISRIVADAFKNQGIQKVKFISFPPIRALSQTFSGKYDVSISWSKSETRLKNSILASLYSRINSIFFP